MLSNFASSPARIVACIDLDYFYAQSEEIRNPEIKTKPVVVCVYSGRTEESGAVSTANYVARKLGVKSGIPIAKAKSILSSHPDSVFLPMDEEYYERVSSGVMEIVKSHSLLFEQVSIDEAFTDLTSKSRLDYKAASETGLAIKAEIKEKSGLTCSIGVAPNKLLAKMASDSSKPDGFKVIEPKDVQSFLKDMPVQKLIGIGPKIESKLNSLGILKIGELALANEQSLAEKLGKNAGPRIRLLAMGIDEDPVRERAPTQYSRIVTLKADAESFTFADEINGLAQDVSGQLRSAGKKCKTVGIICITNTLKTKNRSRTVLGWIDSPKEIFQESERLFKELFDEGEVPKIRRIGVRVSNFSAEKGSVGGREQTQPFSSSDLDDSSSSSLTRYF